MQQNIGLEEARNLLAARLPQPKQERVPLLGANLRVLSEDLHALVDHPSLDDSALDGYAVRAEDTLAATPEDPVVLRVVGAVAAGASLHMHALEVGQAVQVFTGAPVPPGTTGIVMVEDTETRDGVLRVLRPALPEIRKRGQDLQRGQMYLPRGTVLRGPQIALAAAMGHALLPVYEQPRLEILSTGDEITEPGEPLPVGGVYNANSYGLAAMVHSFGGVAKLLPKTKDDLGALRQTFAQPSDAHLTLTIGGVSMGERDFVRLLLQEEGQIDFWRIRVKPGGPPLLGSYKNRLVFGLPGNPVSSLVVFVMVVKAALYQRWGVLEPAFETVQAIATSAFRASGNKTGLQRAQLQQDGTAFTVRAFGNQSSQVLRSLVQSNALAVVPPHKNIQEGETLEVIRL